MSLIYDLWRLPVADTSSLYITRLLSTMYCESVSRTSTSTSTSTRGCIWIFCHVGATTMCMCTSAAAAAAAAALLLLPLLLPHQPPCPASGVWWLVWAAVSVGGRRETPRAGSRVTYVSKTEHRERCLKTSQLKRAAPCAVPSGVKFSRARTCTTTLAWRVQTV